MNKTTQQIYDDVINELTPLFETRILERIKHYEIIKSEKLLQDNEDKKSYINKVTIICCKHFGVTFDELKSKCRVRNIVSCRQALVGILFESRYRYALYEIGDFINRDHATIIHYKKKYSNYMEMERDWQLLISDIKYEINESSL